MFTFDPTIEPEFTGGCCGVSVEVSKVGGGTLGRAYVGAWQYRVRWVGDVRPEEVGTFECAVPMSHARAARYVSFYYGADDGEVW
jgi:hypothetical protein